MNEVCKKIKCGDSIQISEIHISKLETCDLEEFKCDNKNISDFFKNESKHLERNVTYVFIDINEKRIIGFYSLCCNCITTMVEDKDERGNRFTYKKNIPAIEIDFFAIDEDYRKMPYHKDSKRYDTLSKYLFLYVLEEIKQISKILVGAEYICLYSVPKAKNFYKRCGFKRFTEYMIKDRNPYFNECEGMFKKIDKT